MQPSASSMYIPVPATAAMIEKQASDTLRHSDDSEELTNQRVWTLVKTFTITNGLKGVIRTKFALRTTSNGDFADGIIRLNGVDLGTKRSRDVNTYAVFTEDLTVDLVAGDEVQYWAMSVQVVGSYVKEFRLYYDNVNVVAVT